MGWFSTWHWIGIGVLALFIVRWTLRSSKRTKTEPKRDDRRPPLVDKDDGHLPVTDRQLDYIEDLCDGLGREVPDDIDFYNRAQASAFITALLKERGGEDREEPLEPRPGPR